MVFRPSITVFVFALFLGGIALPAHGDSHSRGFYDPSSKYREWFKETKRYQGLSAEEIARASRKTRSSSKAPSKASSKAPTSVTYPYPEKKFVMTETLWKKSAAAIVSGQFEWHDTEIIRQGAEAGANPPAMDLLAWMYQEGRGLNQDYRKAYMWYERAKLAGVKKSRGSSVKIYDRMSERDKYFADLQLAEDVDKVRSGGGPGSIGKAGTGDIQRIKTHVLGDKREREFFGNNFKP